MTSNLRDTTIYDTWDALAELLAPLDYGSHLDNPGGTLFHVGFPEDQVELGWENVVLIGGIQAHNEETWTFGEKRRKERYDLLVVCTSAVPGASHVECRDRLRTLDAAVSDAVRGSVVAPSRSPRPDVTGVDWWEVTSRSPLIVGTKNGHMARVELTVSVLAHI